MGCLVDKNTITNLNNASPGCSIGFNSSIPFKGDDCFTVKVINNNQMYIALIDDLKN